MDKIQKLTKLEMSVLVIMGVCYIVSLYFAILDNRNYALLFFTLHGILTMVFFYISQDRFIQAALDLEENQTVYYDDTENRNMIDSLKHENSELSRKLNNTFSDIEKIRKENEQLLRKISENELKNSFDSDMTGLNVLLPQPENVEEVDLIALIRGVYEKYQEICKSHGIKLELTTTLSSLIMKCDRHYIDIIFSSIIDNAIKYMNRNGSIVTTVSNIGDEGIFIVCKDNGDGLPAEELQYIFNLNYQGSNKKGGNGLGLTQVKAIVKHYGGNVYAKSEDNEGMAIYLQFPVENRG